MFPYINQGFVHFKTNEIGDMQLHIQNDEKKRIDTLLQSMPNYW